MDASLHHWLTTGRAFAARDLSHACVSEMTFYINSVTQNDDPWQIARFATTETHKQNWKVRE